MTQFSVSTSSEQSIYAALELSKNSWLLAIQVPGQDNPSLYPIRGGNAEGLMAKLDAARDRVAQLTGQTPKVALCYEAGYDGFWLARFVLQRGIDCLVMEPASLQVNRRARRVKTDRIDVEVERERDKAPTPCVATERKRHQLLRLKGVGPALSSTLTREVYYRQFVNRRQVAS